MRIIAVIAFASVVITALSALTAWPVMLLWGAIAGTYGWPTMGFGTAVQVCLLVGILTNLNFDSDSK